MHYLTKDELERLFSASRAKNQLHWQGLVTTFYFGLRVSELLAIRAEDVADHQLHIRRLKRSRATIQPIPRKYPSPSFECRLESLVSACGADKPVFPWTRQRCDQFIKDYCRAAGIHSSKAHFHVLKHSCAMVIWKQTHQLGQIQAFLGHKSASSSMIYLAESSSQQAQMAMEEF